MSAPPWLDPELVARGREPMHAVPRAPGLSLDGTWRFQLLRHPGEDLGDRWAEAPVPSLWTMQETWDKPQYTNVQMPFPGQPPVVPEVNPTGVYEREVEVPHDWDGRRVVLHVGAAESVLIVEIDGREVGISKDSHLAAEFDVTTDLTPGTHTIRLTVIKWSDATYIEDQDQWWHGGITRPVWLYTTGKTYLADISAQVGLDEDLTTGTLDLRVQVGAASPERRDGLPGRGDHRGDGCATRGRVGPVRAALLAARSGHPGCRPPARGPRRRGPRGGRREPGNGSARASSPPASARSRSRPASRTSSRGRPSSRVSTTSMSSSAIETGRSSTRPPCRSASGRSRSAAWTCSSTASASSSAA